VPAFDKSGLPQTEMAPLAWSLFWPGGFPAGEVKFEGVIVCLLTRLTVPLPVIPEAMPWCTLLLLLRAVLLIFVGYFHFLTVFRKPAY
jgi:hypothetical protein